MPLCEITGEECTTLHNHHIIPREFGGLTGPTVNISPSLHDAIHRCAGSSILKARLLNKYKGGTQRAVNMLLEAIEEANSSLEKQCKRQVTITFNEEEWKILSRLSRDMNKSVSFVTNNLIKNLLKRSK